MGGPRTANRGSAAIHSSDFHWIAVLHFNTVRLRHPDVKYGQLHNILGVSEELTWAIERARLEAIRNEQLLK
jgi:hypothetical protein